MFFRKSMILIRLLVILVQEFDSKWVVICAREAAEPSFRSEVDPGGVARSRVTAFAR